MQQKKTQPIIFLVSASEFSAIEQVVRSSGLCRSEVLRRALRVALPILAQVSFPGAPGQTQEFLSEGARG